MTPQALREQSPAVSPAAGVCDESACLLNDELHRCAARHPAGPGSLVVGDYQDPFKLREIDDPNCFDRPAGIANPSTGVRNASVVFNGCITRAVLVVFLPWRLRRTVEVACNSEAGSIGLIRLPPFGRRVQAILFPVIRD